VSGKQERDPTLISAGVSVGSQLVRSLAPQFLALIIVTALALAGLFWFVNARAEHTVTLINQLLQACLQRDRQ
jgi:hypothetical protein